MRVVEGVSQPDSNPEALFGGSKRAIYLVDAGFRACMTSLDDRARLLGRLARGATLAARTALPVDTNPVPADWTHVTKVDPEEAKKLPLLFPLYLQHTSAVSVGGSADVTAANTEATFDLLAPSSVPVVHEPSGPRHVTQRTREQADLLAIPEVLNGDSDSLVGQLGAGTEYIREELVPDMLDDELPWLPDFAADSLANLATSWLLAEAVFEAYVIQNPDSAAAREANVSADDLLTRDEAKQHAMAAERHLESELVYLEYSGTYGGEEAVEILESVSPALSWSRLWYGGGLDSREHVEAMLDAGADAVVVGDAFHRVAQEEADLCERAARELDGSVALDASATSNANATTDGDATDVREWVRETVAVGDSAAAAFLATIPSVAEPERLAERYLTETVRAWLALRELSADRENGESVGLPSASKVAYSALASEVTNALGDADTELVGRCLHTLLVGDEDESGRPGAIDDDGHVEDAVANHLAVSLSSD
jgi:phosphoglycerol geranylgeranyltransferase